MCWCIYFTHRYDTEYWILACRWVQSDWLSCDCRLRWIVTWLKFTEVQLDGASVCRSPSSMDGRPLNQITEDQLHCGEILATVNNKSIILQNAYEKRDTHQFLVPYTGLYNYTEKKVKWGYVMDINIIHAFDSWISTYIAGQNLS